jgi:hypothetical protein
MIPINEDHLRQVLREWVAHYNRGPHASLGLGIPEHSTREPASASDVYLIPDGCSVVAKPILGGLRHEYRLERKVA